MYRENNAEVEKEVIEPFNEVINYIDGKAIIKDELDVIYVCEIPEEFVILGDPMELKDLTPLKELPEADQQAIMEAIAE